MAVTGLSESDAAWIIETFLPATQWLKQIMLPRLLATVTSVGNANEQHAIFLDDVLEKVDQSFPEVYSGMSTAKDRSSYERLEDTVGDMMQGLKGEGVDVPVQTLVPGGLG